jgi:hypothetical protein
LVWIPKYRAKPPKAPKRKKRTKAASAVMLKSSRYRLTRAELREDVAIPASPEHVIKSAVRLRPVRFEK